MRNGLRIVREGQRYSLSVNSDETGLFESDLRLGEASTSVRITLGLLYDQSFYFNTFHIQDSDSGNIISYYWIQFPHWFAAAVFGVFPFGRLSYLVVKRLRPAPEGLCLSCGYDLRATPNRCPECGMVPDKS
jgi:hypothetical protein